MSSKPVLHYWNGRGRAEIIRLVMATIGVDWTESHLKEAEDMDKLKSDGKLLFGQVPLLEIDGKNLIQTGSIIRYLVSSRRPNLLGNNEDERVRIDMVFEGTRDFLGGAWMSYGFAGYDEVREKAKTVFLPKYLPLFEKILKENGSNGYLVGNSLSLADIGLLEPLLWVEELCAQDEFNAYPEIRKFLKVVKEDKNIAGYLNGPRRPRINDDEYVASVKRVLRW